MQGTSITKKFNQMHGIWIVPRFWWSQHPTFDIKFDRFGFHVLSNVAKLSLGNRKFVNYTPVLTIV